MKIDLITKEEFEALINKMGKVQDLLERFINGSNQNDLLSNKEVADILKVSNRTLQSYRDTGKIKFSQIGRKIYYEKQYVKEMIMKSKID